MKAIKELTFEKACEIESLDPQNIIPDFSFLPEKDRKSMQAHIKIVIMIRAANRLANDGKEWIPDFDNDEYKYQPWFEKGSSGFRSDGYGYRGSRSGVGSRLCFISYDAMMAMVNNENYMQIYNEYAL